MKKDEFYTMREQNGAEGEGTEKARQAKTQATPSHIHNIFKKRAHLFQRDRVSCMQPLV